MQGSEFDKSLGSEERKVWLSVKNVIRNFLRNHTSKNCKRYVSTISTKFHGLNIKISLKIHFLHSHLRANTNFQKIDSFLAKMVDDYVGQKKIFTELRASSVWHLATRLGRSERSSLRNVYPKQISLTDYTL